MSCRALLRASMMVMSVIQGRARRSLRPCATPPHAQGTQVLGLHRGFVDTDLVRDIPGPKSTPDAVVRAAFDVLEAGAAEVAADAITRRVQRGVAAEPAADLQPPMGKAKQPR